MCKFGSQVNLVMCKFGSRVNNFFCKFGSRVKRESVNLGNRPILHRATLAAPSRPPPKKGSLRQAALACVQRLQAASISPVHTQSTKKRPTLPQTFLPWLRSDLQIGEESPERELLRTQPTPQQTPLKSPSPSSPLATGFSPPAPLAFTHPKIQEGFEIPVEVAQVEEVDKLEDSDWETIDDCENDCENNFPTIDLSCEDWPEKYTKSIRKFHSNGNVVNCENCEGIFTAEHQC